MSKRSVFTTITPLPSGVSRETALSFLHDHMGMIDLNPLITDRYIIAAPHYASDDERQCTWYSLTDKISYLPGGVASGEVSYTCAFHDLPDGLQTHCYAPMGLDIREKWSVAGSLPGEPQQPRELGLNAPRVGLYIREDVEMKCNILMSSFVKKTLKKAHATLVQTLAVKAKTRSFHSYSPPSSVSITLAGEPSPPSSTACSRRSSPRNSDCLAPNRQARSQSPHSLAPPALNVGHAGHGRSVSAGAPATRYQLPSQQQMQQPYHDKASWRASDVPQRNGTQYHGPSKPQDYADFATMNPFDAVTPIEQATPQYRPYSSHGKAPPPLPTQMPPSVHVAELE